MNTKLEFQRKKANMIKIALQTDKLQSHFQKH